MNRAVDQLQQIFTSVRLPGSERWLLTLAAVCLSAALWNSNTADRAERTQAAFAGPVTLASDTSVSELEAAFERVHQQVTPSVVSLHVTRNATITIDGKETRLAQLVRVNGTGCVVDAAGLILTNEHVVQDAQTITVIFHDGVELVGRVLASDVRNDLAIIQVDRQDLRPIRWCDWPDVRRGQWVLAIGNPYGIARDGQASLAVGVIANLGRRLPNLGVEQDRLYTNLIQTTTPVHPGNSGGPLFNLDGEVVGIVTAVYLRAGVEDGVGFAIAATPAKRAIIEQLCGGTAAPHAYLGLVVQDIEAGDGTVRPTVIAIDPEGPAASTDISVGDVITGFSGAIVNSADQLAEQISALTPQVDVTLALERDGRSIATRTVLEKRVPARITWMRDSWLAWRGARSNPAGAAVTPGAATTQP